MKLMGKVFSVHALTVYSSPYDSDIAVLFEKNMENILKSVLLTYVLGGGQSIVWPLL